MSITTVPFQEDALQSHDRFAIIVKSPTFGTIWRWRMVRFRRKSSQQESLLLLFLTNTTHYFNFVRYTQIPTKTISDGSPAEQSTVCNNGVLFQDY